MTFEVANVSQASCVSQVKGDTLTGDQESLEFLLIQPLIGEVVSNPVDVLPLNLYYSPFHPSIELGPEVQNLRAIASTFIT